MGWRITEPPKADANSYTYKDWIIKVYQYLVNSSLVITTASDYQARMTDKYILVDATGGARTITLPFASTNLGKEIVVKKIDASGNSVFAISRGSETIDGAASVSTATKLATIKVVSDNSNWYLW